MDGFNLLSCFFVALWASCQAYPFRIELSAFEYLRRFEKPLNLGKCPDRLIVYPNGVGRHQCFYPNRTGEVNLREKQVHSRRSVAISDATELLQNIGVCDYKSAEYFGLMNDKKDCLENEIASKLSFKKKQVTLLYFEHYRPSINYLVPSDNMDNIPDSFNLHVNNTYYTDQIGIGTEEVIIVELVFSKEDLAIRTKEMFAQHSHTLSSYLEIVSTRIGLPRKVKVIRLSTADLDLEQKVYKGVSSLADAKRFVKRCEDRIARIKRDIKSGRGTYHLKYGFRKYEVGPVAIPLSTVSESDKRRSWEDVNLLQVKSNRVYVIYKRYRKTCKTSAHKFCPYIRHTLKELKRVITLIHTQRRDWSQLPYEQQGPWIKKGIDAVKLYKNRLHMAVKALKRWQRQNPNLSQR